MKTFAFEIILDISTPLNGCIDTNTKDAKAKEQENAKPFNHCPTCTFPLYLGITSVITMWTCHLLGLFVSFIVIRRIFAFLSIVRDLLDRGILPRGYSVLLLFLDDVLQLLLVMDGIFIIWIFNVVEFFNFVFRHILKMI